MKNRGRSLLCWTMVLLASVAVTAPMAHVLELPNKLGLDGPSWLMIQQRLYRGWGSVFGPVDIAAIAVGLAIAWIVRHDRLALRSIVVAVGIYAAMVAVFFIFNAPVNAAFSGWTAATMPDDWTRYRTQWETGHALTALLSLAALVFVIRACTRVRSS